MAMTYSSLIGPKGSAGSIMNWVGYSKIDVPTALDEAQSLIFMALRVREMRTTWVFGISAGNCSIALPDRFLDPLGQVRDTTNQLWMPQRDQPVIEGRRNYDSTVTGSFGADPFTAVAGSNLVDVALTGHGLTEGSTIVPAGANPVGGLDLNAPFPITEVVDENTFIISTGDDSATSSATGGGSAITYTADQLIAGSAMQWAIFDERLNLDVALTDDANYRLPYFRAPQLLSANNQSNWLTNRYPRLIRAATNAAAADQMKDDEEYQKGTAALTTMIEGINVENEMYMRGGIYETDTPTPGDYY